MTVTALLTERKFHKLRKDSDQNDSELRTQLLPSGPFAPAVPQAALDSDQRGLGLSPPPQVPKGEGGGMRAQRSRVMYRLESGLQQVSLNIHMHGRTAHGFFSL